MLFVPGMFSKSGGMALNIAAPKKWNSLRTVLLQHCFLWKRIGQVFS